MLKQWKEKRAERKAMKKITAEVQAQKDMRERCLEKVKYIDYDTADQMIRAAEAIRKYVEEGSGG